MEICYQISQQNYQPIDASALKYLRKRYSVPKRFAEGQGKQNLGKKRNSVSFSLSKAVQQFLVSAFYPQGFFLAYNNFVIRYLTINMINKQKIMIYIYTDSPSDTGSFRGLCKKYCKDEGKAFQCQFPKFKKTVIVQKKNDQTGKTQSVQQIIQVQIPQNNNGVKDFQDEIFKVFEQSSTNQHLFIILQHNRMGGETKGIQNPYGVYAQEKFKGRQINGRRILLFDGTPDYSHPYNSDAKGWKQFNSIFYNYWHINKGTETFNTNIFNRNAVFDFLSFNLTPTPLQLVHFNIFTQSNEIQNVFNNEVQVFRMKQIVKDFGVDLVKPIIIHQKVNITCLVYIKNILQKCLTDPISTIVFLNDNFYITGHYQDKQYKATCTFDLDSHKNWQNYLKAIQFYSSQQLVGYSLGLINLKKYLKKEKDQDEKRLHQFYYASGFNAGELARVLQHRYLGCRKMMRDRKKSQKHS